MQETFNRRLKAEMERLQETVMQACDAHYVRLREEMKRQVDHIGAVAKVRHHLAALEGIA